jgi:1-pyrroline-5-carboxylate dehydrogenase
MAAPGFRVTYATMSADDDALHAAYDDGIVEARAGLGLTHPFVVDGAERTGAGTHREMSPVDNEVVIGEFA